jgi:hypothetical protein
MGTWACSSGPCRWVDRLLLVCMVVVVCVVAVLQQQYPAYFFVFLPFCTCLQHPTGPTSCCSRTANSCMQHNTLAAQHVSCLCAGARLLCACKRMLQSMRNKQEVCDVASLCRS